MLKRLARRLSVLVRLHSADDDLREEMAHHRALVEATYREHGLSARDAHDAARQQMGNETYMREESRAVWLWPGVENVLQDVRYAVRGLRRSPAFAIVAVLSLALGIGANTTIFSLIHALLLARVPVSAPTELVSMRRSLGAKGVDDSFSRAEFEALATSRVPLTMFASRGTSLDLDGVAINVWLDAVDGQYFDLLGIRAERGRLISSSDNASSAQIAVITDRFWRGRFNADPGVLGRTVKISGQSFTIVGVMPQRFAGVRFPAFTDIAVPYRTATSLGVIAERDSHQRNVTIVGRRESAQPLESVRDQLRAVWSRCCADNALVTLSKSFPAGKTQLDLIDVSRGIPQMKLDLRGQYSRTLFALMAGVGILLLAACANVANLLLARSTARSGELAVRLALGASRGRLMMQLMIESLLLAVLGAIGGWLLAEWSTTILLRVGIGELSAIVAPPSGGGVLLFTTAVSVAAAVVFGLIPAVRVLHNDLIATIKHGGRGRARASRSWLDRGLVALQISLALLLVSGATLLVQTLRNLQSTNIGFDPSGRFAVNAETRGTAYEKQLMTSQMADEILVRVRAIPGVKSAGFGSLVPVYGGRGVSDLVSVRGAAPLADGDADTWFVGVTPGYFASLGIPLLAGRDIDPPVTSRSRDAIRNVVINERFAKKFFTDRNPLGQTFQDHDDGDTVVTENRVIGVVGDAKFMGLRDPAQPAYFVPVADHDWRYLVLVVRPTPGAPPVGNAVSRAIAAAAPGIAIGDPENLSASVDAALVRERMSATLASLFGLMALSLVAVGLYGVMLYQVTERTTEFGIRIALGARGTAVVGMVLRQSLGIVGIGVVLGAPLAILAGHAVASQLYGVAPYDLSALAIAAAILVLVAIVASFVPVRRAMSVDPMTALRAD